MGDGDQPYDASRVAEKLSKVSQGGTSALNRRDDHKDIDIALRLALRRERVTARPGRRTSAHCKHEQVVQQRLLGPRASTDTAHGSFSEIRRKTGPASSNATSDPSVVDEFDMVRPDTAVIFEDQPVACITTVPYGNEREAF